MRFYTQIRCMEGLLHISYNIDFQKGAARLENEKKCKENKKHFVQSELKKRLQIVVDQVKPGHGTTNDGNTARKFFSDPETVSEVLGLNYDWVRRIAVIMQVINLDLSIDHEKFENFCMGTFNLYLQHYSWYPMPPSMHKVLIHGAEIMKACSIPLGRLSEEALESTNKITKNARTNHSRKCNRALTNEDVLHHLLLSLDPVISSMRDLGKRTRKELFPECQEFILAEENEKDSHDEEE